MGNHCIAMGPDGACRELSQAPYVGEIPLMGSVGVGGLNAPPDIRTIQDALNQVSFFNGGPELKLKTDSRIGDKTIGAIMRFQKIACKMPVPDGRVDVGRLTHRTLAQYYIGANPYILQLVALYVPEALQWIVAAQSAVDEAAAHLSGSSAPTRFGWKLAIKYFHVEQLPTWQAAIELNRLRELYRKMQWVIQNRPALTSGEFGYLQADDKEPFWVAYSYNGGFDLGSVMTTDVNPKNRLVQRMDAIYICTRRLNPKCTETTINVIVHELSHFTGPGRSSPDRIADYSYSDKPDFFKLSPFLAFRTAECIALFAGEAKLKRVPHTR